MLVSLLFLFWLCLLSRPVLSLLKTKRTIDTDQGKMKIKTYFFKQIFANKGQIPDLCKIGLILVQLQQDP